MFMSIVVVTVCLSSSIVLAAYDKPYYAEEDAKSLFEDFVKEHNKVYDRREYYERLEIFKATLKDINERNAKFPDTVYAVNHFADLKPHELQQYLGLKMPNETLPKLEMPAGWSAPASLDWRTKDAVTHVKNQGHCGTCYIFSALGEIEGQYAIKYQQCVAFSEQQALDCLTSGSCYGGYMEKVSREFAHKKMKLEKEADYPAYHDQKAKCGYDPSKGLAEIKVDSCKRFEMLDEEQLKAKLAEHGPISIGICAMDFLCYKGGIVEPHVCNQQISPSIDHGVLLVGYGEENGKQFWIIKNSWGANWGENGYGRMLLGVNTCDIGYYLVTSSVV